jgi:hypothetical protein
MGLRRLKFNPKPQTQTQTYLLSCSCSCLFKLLSLFSLTFSHSLTYSYSPSRVKPARTRTKKSRIYQSKCNEKWLAKGAYFDKKPEDIKEFISEKNDENLSSLADAYNKDVGRDFIGTMEANEAIPVYEHFTYLDAFSRYGVNEYNGFSYDIRWSETE